MKDASPEQVRAWQQSVPPMQHEASEIIRYEGMAETYTAVREYKMQMESRRADVILLVNGAVVVIELKGALNTSMAAID